MVKMETENENMCQVIASRDRYPSGENPVSFGYAYVSNGESP